MVGLSGEGTAGLSFRLCKQPLLGMKEGTGVVLGKCLEKERGRAGKQMRSKSLGLPDAHPASLGSGV